MCYFLAPHNVYLLAALLLLLVIFVLLRRRQPKNIVAYKTENGSVTISRSAVIELVRTSCEQLDQVNRPNLRVFTKKGLTHFTVRIQLTSGGHLKDVEQTLQNHLRKSLSQNLGIENLGDINIIVTSFKSSRVQQEKDMSATDTPLPLSEEDYAQDSDEPDLEESEER